MKGKRETNENGSLDHNNLVVIKTRLQKLKYLFFGYINDRNLNYINVIIKTSKNEIKLNFSIDKDKDKDKHS